MLDILSSFLEAKWCVSGVQTLTEINCPWNLASIGAGEGIRTLDFNLGKVAEYSKALPFLKETIPFFVEKMNEY